MLTILCLVGMLPVLVLGISLGINSYRTVLKYREKDMTNTLQQACGIVDYQMYACQQMMNYFVYNQDVINFLECDPTKKTQRRRREKSLGRDSKPPESQLPCNRQPPPRQRSSKVARAP